MKTSGINGFGVEEDQQAGQTGQGAQGWDRGLRRPVATGGTGPASSHLSCLPSPGAPATTSPSGDAGPRHYLGPVNLHLGSMARGMNKTCSCSESKDKRMSKSNFAPKNGYLGGYSNGPPRRRSPHLDGGGWRVLSGQVFRACYFHILGRSEREGQRGTETDSGDRGREGPVPAL